MATDINAQAGKGARKHRNVSTPAYRSGWEKIFGNGKRNLLTTKTPDVKQKEI